MKNSFQGKVASFYGDSITEFNQHYTKGYHSWVQDILGLESYHNFGVSGYETHRVYQKICETQDQADLVCVMCGTNDVNHGIPLGAPGDSTLDTTYGALNLMCDTLRKKYPTSIIILMTPHYQERYVHPDGITSSQVAEAVCSVGNKYNLPVFDCYNLSGINADNLSQLTEDGCHWNNDGHALVGKKLATFLLNLAP